MDTVADDALRAAGVGRDGRLRGGWPGALERIHAHASWQDVVRDRSLIPYVYQSMEWAWEVFRTRPQPVFMLDMDAPGFEWQGIIIRYICSTQPDTQIVHFLVDGCGGAGKTSFAKWLVSNKNALFVGGQSTDADCAAWDGQRIVIFDCSYAIPAAAMPYQAIFAMKDGLMGHAQNQCRTRITALPLHVLVFAAQRPDATHARADRCNIMDLEQLRQKHSELEVNDFFPSARCPMSAVSPFQRRRSIALADSIDAPRYSV